MSSGATEAWQVLLGTFSISAEIGSLRCSLAPHAQSFEVEVIDTKRRDGSVVSRSGEHFLSLFRLALPVALWLAVRGGGGR